MKYAPKAKRKINLKIAIPIMVIVLVAAYFGAQNLLQNEEERNKFSVCGLTFEKSKEALEKVYDENYTISDYLFYGESLNLYHDTYNVETTDDLAGKSVILKDICSDKSYSFVIRNAVDAQVLLTNITEGYYEVYVVENLIEKRVVFTKAVNESMRTLVRNDKQYKINLLADTDYFTQREINEDKNYLYLVASEVKKDDKVYDIAIDPAGYDKDFIYQLNKGSEANGLVEYQETYKAANLLKEKLEASGLKVLIVRNKEEELNSYGEDGRLERAYKAQAKYYIKLHFEESNNAYQGMDIYYSGHANGAFSKQIIYHMSRNSDMIISSVYNTNDPGNVQCSFYKSDVDGRMVYDNDLVIREAGGKATQAGMYSKNAQEGTASFAKDNVFGMNAININLGYLSDQNDVDYWVNHTEEYMNALAEGILSYLNLEQE